MSARIPFFTSSVEKPTVAAAKADQPVDFQPDPTNPLFSGLTSAGQQMVEATLSSGSDSTTTRSGTTSGLFGAGANRRARSGTVNQKDIVGTALIRPSTTGPYAKGQGKQQRPDTADPFSAGRNGNGLTRENSHPGTRIMAPTPVVHAGQLANNINRISLDDEGFKVPSIPSLLGPPDRTPSGQTDAHIPAGTERNGVDNRGDWPDNAYRLRLGSRQASRKPDISAALSEDDTLQGNGESLDSTSFKLPGTNDGRDTRNRNGPRRLLFNGKPCQQTSARRSPEDFGILGHEVNDNGRVVQVAGQKRSRDDMEDDDGVANGGPTERKKLGRALQEDRSQFEIADRDNYIQAGHHDYSASGGRPKNTPKLHIQQMAQLQPGCNTDGGMLGSPREGSALDAVLGLDSDTLTRDYVGQYDRLSEKWNQCDEHDWVAGAEALASKYSALLDFVKDHFVEKAKNYASFHAKLDNRHRVLEERDRFLVTAKEKWVKESRNVLG